MIAPEARRFFFAHVQKAAGTSLFMQLKRNFDEDEIYPAPSDRVPGPAPILFVSQLQNRYRVRRDRIRVVTGHFPIATTELLGDSFVTLTLLRDPVERTLSFLRHYQRKNPADDDRTLEELYDDPIRFHGLIHNNMVKMFSLSAAEMSRGDGLMTHVEDFSNARLECAKRQLERVDVLGIDAEYEAFLAELTTRFGWQLGAPMYANRTIHTDVASSFRRRIASDNKADVELFEFGCGLVAGRRRDSVSS
jgi:hypothetical protein